MRIQSLASLLFVMGIYICIIMFILLLALWQLIIAPKNNIISAKNFRASSVESNKKLPFVIIDPKNSESMKPTQSFADSNSTKIPNNQLPVNNTYSFGNCTWYAKHRRPDLPNSLGNAGTWFNRARALGIATGSTPKVGAIGQRNNHVVFVEQVNQDGSVFISEMNRKGLNIISTRTIPADYFLYIY